MTSADLTAGPHEDEPHGDHASKLNWLRAAVLGANDGIVSVVETLKGHPLFGHVTLTRAARSPIAALVTQLLDDAG